jgi:hypothetical protein
LLIESCCSSSVRRARYQPEGVRNFGGQRYGMRPAPDDVSAIRPHVYPMIETSAASGTSPA